MFRPQPPPLGSNKFPSSSSKSEKIQRPSSLGGQGRMRDEKVRECMCSGAKEALETVEHPKNPGPGSAVPESAGISSNKKRKIEPGAHDSSTWGRQQGKSDAPTQTDTLEEKELPSNYKHDTLRRCLEYLFSAPPLTPSPQQSFGVWASGGLIFACVFGFSTFWTAILVGAVAIAVQWLAIYRPAWFPRWVLRRMPVFARGHDVSILDPWRRVGEYGLKEPICALESEGRVSQDGRAQRRLCRICAARQSWGTTVWKAANQSVVVKQYDASAGEERMWREVENLLKVQHPRIIKPTVLFQDLEKRVGYVEFPFCRGGDMEHLLDWLRTDQQSADGEVLEQVLRDVLAALHHVHVNDMVHCNVKPENVVIDVCDGSMRARLAGFGMSVDTTRQSCSAPRNGSVLTLAPELFRGGPPTARSDMYSFGGLCLATVYPSLAATWQQLGYHKWTEGQPRISVKASLPFDPRDPDGVWVPRDYYFAGGFALVHTLLMESADQRQPAWRCLDTFDRAAAHRHRFIHDQLAGQLKRNAELDTAVQVAQTQLEAEQQSKVMAVSAAKRTAQQQADRKVASYRARVKPELDQMEGLKEELQEKEREIEKLAPLEAEVELLRANDDKVQGRSQRLSEELASIKQQVREAERSRAAEETRNGELIGQKEGELRQALLERECWRGMARSAATDNKANVHKAQRLQEEIASMKQQAREAERTREAEEKRTRELIRQKEGELEQAQQKERILEDIAKKAQVPVPRYWDCGRDGQVFWDGQGTDIQKIRDNPYMVPKMQDWIRTSVPRDHKLCQESPQHAACDMREARVARVRRIENVAWWMKYCLHKKLLEQRLARAQVPQLRGKVHTQPRFVELEARLNEFMLFHGTDEETAEKIAYGGFDEKFTTNGLYGLGTYFTDNACKSCQYTKKNSSGERVLVVARVLVGLPYLTRRTHKRERYPPCTPGEERPADSIFAEANVPKQGMGHTQRHNEFVVFTPDQAYPEYLVYFR